MKKPIEKTFVDAPNSDEIPLDIENTTAALEEETNSEEPS